jgi:excinuclease ABC subunit A
VGTATEGGGAVPAIVVRNARVNNLKTLSCRLPHNQVTVITGPSGSGKSSLAFETLYAEGQRRFLESLSTYARQFLERMDKPDVEAVENLLPAVALKQENRIKQARSTVASVTNALDSLSVLLTHAASHPCTACGAHTVAHFTPATQAQWLLNPQRQAQGSRLLVLCHLPWAAVEPSLLLKAGFTRALQDATGTLHTLSPKDTAASLQETLEASDQGVLLVLDRLVLKTELSSETLEHRLREALQQVQSLLALLPPTETAEALTPEALLTYWQQAPQATTYQPLPLKLGTHCSTCWAPQTPWALDQLNYLQARGACPTCEGYGRVIGLDTAKIIPNPQLSLEAGAIHPFQTKGHAELQEALVHAAQQANIATNVPYEALPQSAKDWVWQGGGAYPGIRPFFEYLESKRYKVHVRVMLARYRGYFECQACQGTRFHPHVLGLELWGWPLKQWVQASLQTLHQHLAHITLSEAQLPLLGEAFSSLKARIACLCQVGLDYLTLGRAMRTLSSGEAQRVQLAATLGTGLTDTLYVLDEPTVGLHAKDTAQLIEVIHALKDQGNTVVVVEHDPDVILSANHVLEIGPGGGRNGGQVLYQGPATGLASQHTPTALALRGSTALAATAPPFSPQGWVKILGASGYHLNNLNVELPTGCVVGITGVSGAGKSSLMIETLYGHHCLTQGEVPDWEVLPCQRIEGLEAFSQVVLVDQSPLGRSTRSNPATWSKAFDDIRTLFASNTKAQLLGLTAGDFSFNSVGGRCETCEGMGQIEVDLQFMANAWLTCPDCNGQRYQASVLAVDLFGRTINDVLNLSVEEAATFFKTAPKIKKRLQPLLDLGLGYLGLGQSTATLSGGEAQRLKLASYLPAEGQLAKKPCLFLFDEPTAGLHLQDVGVLAKALRRLVAAGHSVFVIEHHLDLLLNAADWVLDLGPEAGAAGGGVVFNGPLTGFLQCQQGHTAPALRAWASTRNR